MEAEAGGSGVPEPPCNFIPGTLVYHRIHTQAAAVRGLLFAVLGSIHLLQLVPLRLPRGAGPTRCCGQRHLGRPRSGPGREPDPDLGPVTEGVLPLAERGIELGRRPCVAGELDVGDLGLTRARFFSRGGSNPRKCRGRQNALYRIYGGL